MGECGGEEGRDGEHAGAGARAAVCASAGRCRASGGPGDLWWHPGAAGRQRGAFLGQFLYRSAWCCVGGVLDGARICGGVFVSERLGRGVSATFRGHNPGAGRSAASGRRRRVAAVYSGGPQRIPTDGGRHRTVRRLRGGTATAGAAVRDRVRVPVRSARGGTRIGSGGPKRSALPVRGGIRLLCSARPPATAQDGLRWRPGAAATAAGAQIAGPAAPPLGTAGTAGVVQAGDRCGRLAGARHPCPAPLRSGHGGRQLAAHAPTGGDIVQWWQAAHLGA
eukprot:ctg_2707.g389